MSGRHVPTILCVDDNAQLLNIRKHMLELRGYRVWATSDAARAFTIAEREPIDLLVLDYRMQPVDGEGIALGIKARSPALPILLISGFPGVIPEHLLHLVDAFVPKGQPVEFFLSAIEAVLHGRPPKKAAQSVHRSDRAARHQLPADRTNNVRRRYNVCAIDEHRGRTKRTVH